MTELEKVEKLREKANVSFSEAKEALEAADGNVLDALIYLEDQGKAIIPAGGGFFSSGAVHDAQEDTGSNQRTSDSNERRSANSGESFGDMMKRLGRFVALLFRKGNSNFLDATKRGETMFSCPVTAVVLLVVFFFWITVPLFVISLFFGFRYRFRGADLGRDSVNRVMDSATDVVEEVKKSFDSKNNNANSEDEV